MARSLTVNHEEKPSTNPLLTGFILLAITWLALGAIIGGAINANATPAAAPTQSAQP